MEKMLSGQLGCSALRRSLTQSEWAGRALPLMPYLINNLANEETVSVSSFASYVIDHLGEPPSSH